MTPHQLAHAALLPVATGPDHAPDRRLVPSMRGVVVGVIALGLGLVLTIAAQGSVSWGDGAVLGMVVMGALVGGSAADRLASRRPQPIGQGGWMTVVVSSQRPTDAEAVPVRPSHPPHPRPERRRLERIARGRRRELADSSRR